MLRAVNHRVLDIVASVIRKSSREKQADSVLRAELKAQRALPPELGRAAARALFAYYRWRGWLEVASPISEQITAAETLQERFAEKPESFTEEELLARAVPAWVREQIEVTPAWVRSLQGEPRLWMRAKAGARGCAAHGAGGLLDSAGPGDGGCGRVSGRAGFISHAAVSGG